jgi:hypothetical protein
VLPAQIFLESVLSNAILYIYTYVHAAQHRHFLQLPPPYAAGQRRTRGEGKRPGNIIGCKIFQTLCAVEPGKGAGNDPVGRDAHPQLCFDAQSTLNIDFRDLKNIGSLSISKKEYIHLSRVYNAA